MTCGELGWKRENSDTGTRNHSFASWMQYCMCRKREATKSYCITGPPHILFEMNTLLDDIFL